MQHERNELMARTRAAREYQPNPATDKLGWAIYVAQSQLSWRRTAGTTSLHTDALLALVEAAIEQHRQRQSS